MAGQREKLSCLFAFRAQLIYCIGLLVLCLAFLSGCSDGKEPLNPLQAVDVAVPVPMRAQPPKELMQPVLATTPRFINPKDTSATSALNPEGEQALRVMIAQLVTRINAWQAWATSE